MKNEEIKNFLNFYHFSDINKYWIESIYEEFLTNPSSIDKYWYTIFKKISNSKIRFNNLNYKSFNNLNLSNKNCSNSYYSNFNNDLDINKIKILNLINTYRFYGYNYAKLDPLQLNKQKSIENVDLRAYDISENDLNKNIGICSNLFNFNKNPIKLNSLIKYLKKTYCGSIGFEYMHIKSFEEKNWIQKRIESISNKSNLSFNDKKRFLRDITAAEELEHYLGNRFPGMKRFSLEGSDVLIPMLKEIIRYSSNINIKEIIFGMAHRGRLNVLVNVFGKKPIDIFNEFIGNYKDDIINTGDVKYHAGFNSNLKIKNKIINLILMPNPSHLEIINPVIMGVVRARLDQFYKNNYSKILPITIHGDASIIGQGVVQETLNMSKSRGYEVGGSIRIIINNQIGFTTLNPLNTKSILDCTNIGKMVEAPIFHVNADDLEAAVLISKIAVDFRYNFKRDVFINLVSYRRHGHNELEDPNVTQPIMYQKIKTHPTSREIYFNKLKLDNVITFKEYNEIKNLYQRSLQKDKSVLKGCNPYSLNFYNQHSLLRKREEGNHIHESEIINLKKLAKCISNVPTYIKMQPHVAKIYSDRRKMAEGKKLFDWGSAENLAYASLIDKGISIRLSGEDSSRGTFFHRHAIIHSQNNGCTYIPLKHIHKNQGKFDIWNSILSEEAILAFEYGYSIAKPYTLTIWEAQFGDFANGAQIVIDQFISSGKNKWGIMCSLVMLLPHGYEGQGPEHSSARIERYLQLCSEQNMQICIPSTPAQFYHILRRQALFNVRIPLIIITPKSLLRHPLSVSKFDDLIAGNFLLSINEIDELDINLVKRVIICSGKIFYDLIKQRRKNNQRDIAILRIEQLYPFPKEEVHNLIRIYSHVYNFIWCQEEPLNQGAWYFIRSHLIKLIPFGSSLKYVGRPPSASTAEGCVNLHLHRQQDLVNKALSIN